MELYLQSLVGLNVHSCTHWLRPRLTPFPPHLGAYTRALLVSQDRRRLLVSHASGSETGEFVINADVLSIFRAIIPTKISYRKTEEFFDLVKGTVA
jgi:hypothetical protein